MACALWKIGQGGSWARVTLLLRGRAHVVTKSLNGEITISARMRSAHPVSNLLAEIEETEVQGQLPALIQMLETLDAKKK